MNYLILELGVYERRCDTAGDDIGDARWECQVPDGQRV